MEITDNLLAAYAEGKVTDTERMAVRQYLTDHPEQLESMMIMMDEDFDIQSEDRDPVTASLSFVEEMDSFMKEVDSGEPATDAPTIGILPLMSKAARNVVDNLCAIRSEAYALRALGIVVSDQELETEAKAQGLLKTDGMPLHSIGLLSEKRGIFTARRFGCSIDDIIGAISKGEMVIVVLDKAELTQSPEEARNNDLQHGATPNHAVIVESVDLERRTITVLDPGPAASSQTCSSDIFQNAWDDSSRYLVTLSNRNNYEPHPLQLDDVPIEPELMELREAIAENAHEVWARTRKDEGWSYGPERDDARKLHPDMLPYSLLPESEKEYDRLMALNTIRLVKKLGWELVKPNK